MFMCVRICFFQCAPPLAYENMAIGRRAHRVRENTRVAVAHPAGSVPLGRLSSGTIILWHINQTLETNGCGLCTWGRCWRHVLEHRRHNA